MRTGLTCVGAALVLAVTSGLTRPPPTSIGGQNVTARPLDPVPRMSSPTRVAVDGSGALVVSDYQSRAVYVIDPASLATLRSFRVDGRPTGVAELGGIVFVGNETARQVEMYTAWGERIGALGGGVKVDAPTDMAVDAAAALLFVVDGGADEVKVFDLGTPGGPLVGTIGGPGLTALDLQNPTGVVLDTAAMQVLVADYGDPAAETDPRVVTYAYDGTPIGVLSGDEGALGFAFSKPQGLMLNDAGRLFVVDAFLGRVIVYDRATGTKLNEIGTFGTGAGELRLPLDAVILGPAQDLYVTNNGSGRIELFAGGGS